MRARKFNKDLHFKAWGKSSHLCKDRSPVKFSKSTAIKFHKNISCKFNILRFHARSQLSSLRNSENQSRNFPFIKNFEIKSICKIFCDKTKKKRQKKPTQLSQWNLKISCRLLPDEHLDSEKLPSKCKVVFADLNKELGEELGKSLKTCSCWLFKWESNQIPDWANRG